MSQTARQHDADLTSTREDVLALMPLPKDQQRDQARRADVIGIFANDAAFVRRIGALMLEQNDEWAYRACCMTLETLSAVNHNPIVSLPAMAASTKPDPALDRRFLHDPVGHNRLADCAGRVDDGGPAFRSVRCRRTMVVLSWATLGPPFVVTALSAFTRGTEVLGKAAWMSGFGQ